jgi:hypothetical protein
MPEKVFESRNTKSRKSGSLFALKNKKGSVLIGGDNTKLQTVLKNVNTLSSKTPNSS